MNSRGPNALNLNAYTQGEHQQQYYDQPQQLPVTQSRNVEQQFDNFIKDIKKYDQILSKVAKNIDDVSNQDQFITDFYPEFINEAIYEDDNQSKIISTSDPQLAKVLEGLQRTNRVVKEQVKGWVFQFAKKTKLTETLITQNHLLRKYIATKDKDIVRLIQTISSQQNTEITELGEKLTQLRQQNGVLIHHLEKMKEEVKDKKQEQETLQRAFEEAQLNSLQIQKKSRVAEQEEQHYSKMVALLQDSIEDMQKRVKKLENQKKRLAAANKSYKEDQSRLQKQLASAEIDKKEIENGLKTKYKDHQTEKDRIIQQIEQCTERVKREKENTRFLEGEISRNQNRIEQYNKFMKELQKRVFESEQALKKCKKELADAVDRQAQFASKIQITQHDIQILKEEFEQLQQKDKAVQQRMKRQIKDCEDANRRELNQWQKRLNEVQRQTAMKILQQKSVLALQHKEIQQWEKKIMDKKDQIQDLKSQMKQIRDNQLLVTELRQKLKTQRT